MDTNIIEIFTDGCCLNNGDKNAKAGIGIWFGIDNPKNISKKLEGEKHTNNRAELFAILTSINILIESKNTDKKIIIYTDSMYSLNSITKWYDNWIKNGWLTSKKQPVENKDLISDIHNLMNKFTDIKLVYVKAHTNKDDRYSIGNKHADLLSKKGANN